MAANSDKPKKKRGKGKPFPKGRSGNPAGRPSAGQSWGEVIKEITDKTPEELLDLIGTASPLAITLRQMPKKVALKYLIVLAGAIGTMNDPNARILQWLADRSEGKVKEQIDITSGNEPILRRIGIDTEKI